MSENSENSSKQCCCDDICDLKARLGKNEALHDYLSRRQDESHERHTQLLSEIGQQRIDLAKLNGMKDWGYFILPSVIAMILGWWGVTSYRTIPEEVKKQLEVAVKKEVSGIKPELQEQIVQAAADVEKLKGQVKVNLDKTNDYLADAEKRRKDYLDGIKSLLVSKQHEFQNVPLNGKPVSVTLNLNCPLVSGEKFDVIASVLSADFHGFNGKDKAGRLYFEANVSSVNKETGDVTVEVTMHAPNADDTLKGNMIVRITAERQR